MCHLLSQEQKAFVDDLVRASVLDVVRLDEVTKMIENSVYKSVDDWFDMQNDTNMFLGHICNSRCLRRTADRKFKCRKLNNLKELFLIHTKYLLTLPDEIGNLANLEVLSMLTSRHTHMSRM